MTTNKPTIKQMQKYGYLNDGMIPISECEAVEMFVDNTAAVYLLHDDNTESLAQTLDEIESHFYWGGMFGIEKGEPVIYKEK